ncbi:hypothetical protein F4604DRAFT_1676377 [Suillus subluteus]|nr:hypothetical protein F4604DRAFT_1676377 [Suillus subluteus]
MLACAVFFLPDTRVQPHLVVVRKMYSLSGKVRRGLDRLKQRIGRRGRTTPMQPTLILRLELYYVGPSLYPHSTLSELETTSPGAQLVSPTESPIALPELDTTSPGAQLASSPQPLSALSELDATSPSSQLVSSPQLPSTLSELYAALPDTRLASSPPPPTSLSELDATSPSAQVVVTDTCSARISRQHHVTLQPVQSSLNEMLKLLSSLETHYSQMVFRFEDMQQNTPIDFGPTKQYSPICGAFRKLCTFIFARCMVSGHKSELDHARSLFQVLDLSASKWLVYLSDDAAAQLHMSEEWFDRVRATQDIKTGLRILQAANGYWSLIDTPFPISQGIHDLDYYLYLLRDGYYDIGGNVFAEAEAAFYHRRHQWCVAILCPDEQ